MAAPSQTLKGGVTVNYLSKDGRVLFVADGISSGAWWGIFYKKSNGNLARFKSVILNAWNNCKWPASPEYLWEFLRAKEAIRQPKTN